MTFKTQPGYLAQAKRLRILGFALSFSLLSLVIGTVLFAAQMTSLSTSAKRQPSLNVRTPVVREAYEALRDVETSQRSYLLTGMPGYLKSYRQFFSRLPSVLGRIDVLGQRDSAFTVRAARIHELVNMRLTELDRAVQIFDPSKPEEAFAAVQSEAGQPYMEELREILREAMTEARDERLKIGQDLAQDGSQTVLLASLAVGALVVTALLAALQIQQLARSRNAYEKELLRSEQQHRAILEGQREMVSLSDRTGRLLYVNPAYAAHFGCAPNDLIGKNLYDMVDRRDRDAVRCYLGGIFERRVISTIENRLVSSKGVEHWVSWTNQVQIDASGRVCMHSVGRDTTSERELARRLAERERFLSQITNASPVRIAYVDLEGRVQYANKASLERYGQPLENVIGRKRSELVEDGDNDFVAPYINEALGGKRSRIEVCEGVSPNCRFFDLELIPDVNDIGIVQGVFGVSVDITQRKEDEQAIKDIADIFEASPDAIVQTDLVGVITYANPIARQALGLSPTEQLGDLSYASFHTPETNELFEASALRIAHKTGSWTGESTLKVGGRIVPVNHLLIAHRGTEGLVSRYSAVLRDISDVVAQRREIKFQTATLTAVVESIPAMVAVYDATCRFRFVNRSFETWTGHARAECIGHTVGKVFGDKEEEISQQWAVRALAGETVSFERDVVSVSQGRQVNVSYIPLRLEDGAIDGFVAVGQDVTEQRAEARRLIHLSERDPLTGLNNRAGVESMLERCMLAGEQDSVAVVYVDLDRFKPINDDFGHAVGDEVLRQFAMRLKATVRPSDVVGRLGGDEFALVLMGVHDEQLAKLVADKVDTIARHPFKVGGRLISVGASVGFAHGIRSADGWKELLDRADRQMYSAKRASRGGAG